MYAGGLFEEDDLKHKVEFAKRGYFVSTKKTFERNISNELYKYKNRDLIVCILTDGIDVELDTSSLMKFIDNKLETWDW